MRLLSMFLAFTAFVTFTQATMNLGNLWFAHNNNGHLLPTRDEQRYIPTIPKDNDILWNEGDNQPEVIKLKFVYPWWENYSKWSKIIRFKKCKLTFTVNVVNSGIQKWVMFDIYGQKCFKLYWKTGAWAQNWNLEIDITSL